ncbi:MAG: polysaccharide pyruvyl transferase family protein, partial [Oscillospiraceae bacterium]
NYECPAIKKADISFDKAYIKNIKNLISSSLYYFINRIKHRKFVRFSKKNISLTQAINTPDKIEKFYDLFVCGSDQVWNYKITNFDKTYFLDFVKDNKKKASYAASFGLSEIPNEYILEYSHLLKSFSHLSVRENEGAKIISDLTGTNCETVLDPTLLLSADKWLTLTKEKTEKKPYILIYLMSKSEKLIDFAYKLSIKTGMKVIYISNSLLKF